MAKMRLVSFVFLAVMALTQPLLAQGMFDPVIIVDDQMITKYELDQRRAMLNALGVKGNLHERAREDLIADRLKVAAAADVGIVATQAQLDQALSDFAGRNGQSIDDVVAMLKSNGVATETLRDFLKANIVWQSLMRQRYANAVSVSDAEIDAALSATSETTSLQILVSEIVLPLIEGQEDEIRKLANDIAKLRSYDEFSNAARQFSVAGSREDGGKLDWISLSNLPPALRPVLLPLSNGEVSEPLELPNAIALFQMRGLSETTPTTSRYSSVEFAVLTVPTTEFSKTLSSLQQVSDKALRCDDFYGLSSGIDQASFAINSMPPSDVPRQESLWLARLDSGEKLIESVTTADGTVEVKLVMLCSRTSVANKDASREEVLARLQNEKLNARATSWLESLKASARIITP